MPGLCGGVTGLGGVTIGTGAGPGGVTIGPGGVTIGPGGVALDENIDVALLYIEDARLDAAPPTWVSVEVEQIVQPEHLRLLPSIVVLRWLLYLRCSIDLMKLHIYYAPAL